MPKSECPGCGALVQGRRNGEGLSIRAEAGMGRRYVREDEGSRSRDEAAEERSHGWRAEVNSGGHCWFVC